ADARPEGHARTRRLVLEAEGKADGVQGGSGESRGRSQGCRRRAVRDVPWRRLRRPERNSARGRPALRVHQEAATGLQGEAAHERWWKHDAGRGDAHRRADRRPRAVRGESALTVAPRIEEAVPMDAAATRDAAFGNASDPIR